jgi:transposase InsO family protein
MSRKGNCWDNSPAESFFDTLKTELPDCLNCSSLSEASEMLFEYLEIYYNRLRMHSTIDYEIPHWYKREVREGPNLLN